MTTVRAVLFDFGGTLYDYATLADAERESLVEVARWGGVEVEPDRAVHTHHLALKRAFRAYLNKPYYLHRDLFRDAVIGMLEDLGAEVDDTNLDRYREAQWARHARDFALREGVIETLEELRRRGLHLGIVSNIDDDQLSRLLGLSGIADRFDAVISSERAGSCKPHPGIFQQALRQANCEPEEALFVGDSLPQDIAGANGLGIRSVLLWHRAGCDPPDRDPRPRHVIRAIPDLLALI